MTSSRHISPKVRTDQSPPDWLNIGLKVRWLNFTQTGARAYFTHYILHDWPDKQAREILLHLKAAMQPGYSKLLLNESILPDGDCPPFYAGQDLNMMCIVAGMERSRKQWAELIDSVGLHILQIWDAPEAGNLDGVIEVILLES